MPVYERPASWCLPKEHEFAHGELTLEEKAAGGIGAIICRKCDFRQVSTSMLTTEERAWCEGEVLRLIREEKA